MSRRSKLKIKATKILCYPEDINSALKLLDAEEFKKSSRDTKGAFLTKDCKIKPIEG